MASKNMVLGIFQYCAENLRVEPSKPSCGVYKLNAKRKGVEADESVQWKIWRMSSLWPGADESRSQFLRRLLRF